MSWLDSLTPENELKSQQQRLEFTTALPPTKPTAVSYTPVVIGSYGITILIMLLVLFWRLYRIARHGANIGFGRKRTTRLFLGQVPRTLLTAIWSGLIFGTVVAAIASAVRWAAS